MEIGEILKRYRKNLGLSQDALAIKLGMGRSGWNKIENGHQDISFATLVLACKALNLSLEQIASHYEGGEILPRLYAPKKSTQRKIELLKTRLAKLEKEARDEQG